MIKINKSDMTLCKLKEYLSYDKESGQFTWIKNTHKYKNRIGSIAGSISKRDSHIELRFMGTLYKASRLAWFYTYGVWPVNHIDHIDHDEQNNCINNLRDVSQAENNKNMSKRSTNTSGITGVWLHTTTSGRIRYNAEIMLNNIKHTLGVFNTLKEAASARKKAEIKFGFHINHGIIKPK